MIKQKKKNIGKSVLSIFLALLMALSCISVSMISASAVETTWYGHSRFTWNGHSAYCLHCGASSSGTLESSDKAIARWKSFSTGKQNNIRYAISAGKLLGYTDTGATNPEWFAVQRLIWELIGGSNTLASGADADACQSQYNKLKTLYASIKKTPDLGSKLMFSIVIVLSCANSNK